VELELRVEFLVGEVFARALELAQSLDIAKSMFPGPISMKASIVPSVRWIAPAPGQARLMFVRSCVRSSGLNGV